MDTRRAAIGIGILALLTALGMVFVGWKAQQAVLIFDDPYGYIKMGRSIAAGEGFAEYGTVLNRRGPLYPLMVGGLFALFGDSPLLIRLVQTVLFAATALLAFDLGRTRFNLRTGIVAGVLCALHPALLRYVADFHIETLLTFLFTLTAWTGARFVDRPGVGRAVAFGAAAGATALAKAVALPVVAAFVGWWLWLRLRAEPGALRRHGALAAAALAGLGMVVLPWTWRNYRTSGGIVLVTTGLGDAFLRGYIFSRWEFATLREPPYTVAEQECNRYFRTLCAREGAVWEQDDLQTERILTKEAKRRLFEDFGGFVRKSVTGVFTFWYQMTGLFNSLVTGGLALAFWALALVGWRRARREGIATWPLFLPILVLNAALAVLLALGRYSVPILPILAVPAAFGVDTLWGRRQG